MQSRNVACLVALACFAAAIPAAAHHSFAAEFDSTQRVTLTGVVTKVEWTNPHVWFWVNVKDEASGEIVNWGAEMGSPNALTRTGWTANTLTAGMVVTFSGSRARDGSSKVNTSNVTVNGKRLGAASSEGNRP